MVPSLSSVKGTGMNQHYNLFLPIHTWRGLMTSLLIKKDYKGRNARNGKSLEHFLASFLELRAFLDKVGCKGSYGVGLKNKFIYFFHFND